jgi:hypothetical protein
MYLVVDHKQMKVIVIDNNVRMGYWASRNNVQEYKVYVTMIRMFNLNFMNDLQQVLGNNSWLAELTNHNYNTHLLR